MVTKNARSSVSSDISFCFTEINTFFVIARKTLIFPILNTMYKIYSNIIAAFFALLAKTVESEFV